MLKSFVEAELAKGQMASVIKLVSFLVEEAQGMRASDIHIDPQSDIMRIRYRVDGYLKEYHVLPLRLHQEIISRIKIIAGLRIDEHQTSQDGRFRLILESKPLDVRVSIAPTYYGENAVLRLLSDNKEAFALESLGFSRVNAEKIRAAVKKPYGMILATGPTGSGKTTTLYTLIKALNTEEVSIVTIEDPIEYAIGGIQQIQVNPRASLAFAGGLRSILRQDPNIIMVGEIRDEETAGIAVNAALTGHLMLSTLHTNDAATTLPRLLDMGIEGYLIASTVNIVIGQRLVRKICPHCKIEQKIILSNIELLKNVIDPEILKSQEKFHCGRGCEKCGQTGYLGRIGVHEILVLDAAVKESIFRREPAAELKRAAVKAGMVPMIEDGFAKAQSGITSIDEILRMFYE